MSEASREFVLALEVLMESFQQDQRVLFRDQRVTALQFFVLRWLSKSSDANMSSLARLLGIRPQSATPIVDTLEEEGLIRRLRSSVDRRESRLALTPKGSRLLQALRATVQMKLSKALDQAPSTSLRTAAEALRIATAALDHQRERLQARKAGTRGSAPPARSIPPR